MDTQSVIQSDITTASRRRRNERFVKGSIVRIAVVNFLTYDHCVFRLNPKLNVIIGPNGTGKSSVVCAICLGLGGKTNVLARAKELSDYIKHGQDEAKIEIELCNQPKNYIISRLIVQSSSGKAVSTWFLNSTQTTVKHIEEVVAGLNIQLSNLCQFLPQERVADFAKMNKIELLENTELAVCPVSMQNDHKWLKDFCNMERDLETKKGDNQDYLDKLIQKNQRVEKEVMRYKERTKLIDDLKCLDQKKAWTVYEIARQEYLRHKHDYQELKKKSMDAQKKTLPLTTKKESITKHIAEIDKQLKKKGEELKTSAAMTKLILDKINEKDDEVQEKWDEFKEREKDEQIRLRKVEQFKLQLSGWQNELDQLEETNVQTQIDDLNSKIRATVTTITQAEHEHSMITERKIKTHSEIKSCEHKIAELNNMSKKRLDILRRRNKDCYNAIQWLRANKSMFKSTIHEPIMLLLTMKNPVHAELIENHISMRDMHAFVCEDPEDNQRFIHEVRERQGLRINVVKAPRTNTGTLVSSNTYKPRIPIENLKKWGFTFYLHESFEAPDAILSYLCKQYRIHDVPVGSAATKAIVDQVTQSSGFSLFFIPTLSSSAPGCRYSVKRSKYSSNSIVGNSALRRAEYLNINVDPVAVQHVQQEKQELIQTLAVDAERLKEIAEERKKLEKKDNDLRIQKKELQTQKNRRKNVENKIMLKQKNLEDLEKSSLDLETLKRGTQKLVGQVILKKKDLTMKFVAKIKTCVDMSIGKGFVQAQYAQCLKQKSFIEGQIHEIKLKNIELIQAVERAESAKEESQKQAKEYLVEAKKKTGGSPDHLSEKFVQFPDELSEIEAKIHEFQARLECCGNTDPKAFEEFNVRKKEIEKLQHKVAEMIEKLKVEREEMEIVKTRWLTPLKDLVSRINGSFSKYFTQMGCAGEVDLHAENEEFDKYGIRIRVKFRSSSSLQELNPFRQSGGERSVSTMLYLVALQSMYTCPFRLVDEINQGMDPNNERRVFEVIVNSSSADSRSQYFLITPKLLPNLTYNRHMSVHCVYNGPHMLPHNTWKLSRFIRKRKQLKYEDEDD